MPKIPDHIANKMDSRPEYATEEAAARNVLKGLWIDKRDRDRLRLKLQNKQSNEYRVTEFDCLTAVLAQSGVQLSGHKGFHRDFLSCATIGKGEKLVDVADNHVGELSRKHDHVVFCRWEGDRTVYIACLIAECELQYLEPPFRVEPSRWSSMVWVVFEVEEFCSSLGDRHEALNWLREFVSES